MKNFVKNMLSDLILRIVYLVSGEFAVPIRSIAYRIIFTVRWEGGADPNNPDYYLHQRRAYLRKPQWHYDWEMKDE